MANVPEHRTFPKPFERQYQSHLKHLKLQGLQPKTIDAYARGMRRIGKYFSYEVADLSEDQLVEYFTELMDSHSWSGVKLDLYGLKFFTEHVLRKPWTMPNFIRPPKVSRLPDIVSVAQAQALFAATRVLSYRVFFFTLYSLGLRLGEGLALTVGDVDAARMRVHVRDATAPWWTVMVAPWMSCAAIGTCTTTRGCCFPTAPAGCVVPMRPPARWSAAACSARCTWSRAAAG